MSGPKDADPPEVLARINEGLALVDIITMQMRRLVGPRANVDDLRSSGREALLAAARSFDASRGVPFVRWANIRVKGAMLDQLRSDASVPRRVYKVLRAMQAAHAVSEGFADDAPPTSAEAADERLSDQLAASAIATALAFFRMRGDDAIEREADPGRSAERLMMDHELSAEMREAIAARPEAERVLLERHYFHDEPLEAIGKSLGLSKSWASRLHARGLEAVARHLKRERAV